LAREKIEDVVTKLGTPVAEQLGLELVDVEYKKEGADWVLRCFIDSPNGVGIDECQHYSMALEKILDEKDPIPGSYLLEVSSPGLERPLKKETDFERFKGQMVRIKLHKALNGQKKYVGELLGYEINDQQVIIKVDQDTIAVPYQDIAKANLVVDLFGIEGGKQRK
jgi:ribosome maturation factor RimP